MAFKYTTGVISRIKKGNTKNGNQWASFSVKDKTFHNCSTFDADIVDKLPPEGSTVFIHGEERGEKYMSKKTGKEEWMNKVLVDKLEVIVGGDVPVLEDKNLPF